MIQFEVDDLQDLTRNLLTNFGLAFTIEDNYFMIQDDRITTEWCELFLSFLPLIEKEFSKFPKTRDSERSLVHYLTRYEFILIFGINYKEEDIYLMTKLLHLDYTSYKEFLYAEDVIPDNLTDFIEKFMLDDFVAYLELRDEMIYGDVISFTFLKFRNKGIFIYIGPKTISLSNVPDPYGTIPRCFPTITEFPPLYFSDVIKHNKLIWIPKNLDYFETEIDYQDLVDQIPDAITGAIIFNDIEYDFILDPEYTDLDTLKEKGGYGSCSKKYPTLIIFAEL